MEREERLRLMADSINKPLIICDAAGYIQYANDSLSRMLGQSQDLLIGQHMKGFLIREHSLRVPGNGSIELERSNSEYHLKRKDGSDLVLSSMSKKLINSHNTVKGRVFFFEDLTEVYSLGSPPHEACFEGLIGQSLPMRQLFKEIIACAQYDFPVLIQGESGTGKELVSQAIHKRSSRADKRFVAVNCAALPEGTLESELFGHVKGAFTGAFREKIGRFALSDGGTIFLDEIGDLAPSLQVKLLRILQEGTYEKVGDSKTLRVNLRIISATNKNLRKEVQAGRFREDLYYRLYVMPLSVPPLRERVEDIPLLVRHFLHEVAGDAYLQSEGIQKDALSTLMEYKWPGNVRELQNAIRFAFVKGKGISIQRNNLPPQIISTKKNELVRTGRRKLSDDLVLHALKKTGGNKKKAAEELGISRATLYRYLNLYQNRN